MIQEEKISLYCPFTRHSKRTNTAETCNKLCGRYVEGSKGEVRCRRCYTIYDFILKDGEFTTERVGPISVKAAPIPEDERIPSQPVQLALDLAHTLPSEENN